MPRSASLRFVSLYSSLLADQVDPLLQDLHDEEGKGALAQLSHGVSRMSKLLRQMGDRDFVDPCRGCNILHKAKFVLEEAYALYHQYVDEDYCQLCVFQEVYIEQWQSLLSKLRLLNDILALVVANPSLKRLPQVKGLQGTSANVFRIDFSIPDHCRSLVEFLQSEVDADPDNNFVTMAAAGEWLKLQALLLTDPSHCNDFGVAFNLLHMATLWQSPFAIAMLLGLGADIDMPTRSARFIDAHSTALDIAIAFNSVPIVKLLIAWGASLETLPRDSTTTSEMPINPPCQAALRAAKEIREVVSQACISALFKDHEGLRHLVLKQAIPPNMRIKGSDLFFIIHHVVANGDAETFALLVEAGWSTLLRTRDGHSLAEIPNTDASLVSTISFYQELEMQSFAIASRLRLLCTTTKSSPQSPPPSAHSWRKIFPSNLSFTASPKEPRRHLVSDIVSKVRSRRMSHI